MCAAHKRSGDFAGQRGLGRVVAPLCVLLALSAQVAAQRREDDALERVLKQRGLTELLERHLELAGGQDPVSRHLARREALLAAYRDTARATDDRLAHLKRATRQLEELLAEVPDHPEAPEWQLQLGIDLLFKQAEPHYNNILFRGGSSEDYAALRELAARAETIFADLGRMEERLTERVETMTEQEFARFERSGVLERLDEVVPRAGYFLRWASFYRIMGELGESGAGDIDEPARKTLREAVEYLTRQVLSDQRPRVETGLHCQSLLLAGMCRRFLGDYRAAEQALNQCVVAAEAVPLAERPADLDWAVSVARLELIRAAADSGQYDAAHQAATDLLEKTRRLEPENFSMMLSLALLDRRVYRRQMEGPGAGTAEADRLRERACGPILDLLRHHPAYESAIFAAVYEQLDEGADVAEWDPVEQMAYLTRVVERLAAQQGPGGASGELVLAAVRAAQAGELLLSAAGPVAEALAPRAVFDLGLLAHLRGEELAAVRHFVRVVREYPRFARVEPAADYAVKIAANLYQDPATRSAAGVRQAFIDATRALVERFSESDAARRWRFFLAGALEDARRWDEAATEYARVDRRHARWEEACYRRVWCLWRGYLEAAGPETGRPQDVNLLPKRAFEVVETARECVEELTRRLAELTDADRADEVARWIASAQLIGAEMRLRPEMQQYREALQMVEGFEQTYADRPDLVVRALRIRLIAYQRLGELDNALGVAAEYVSGDPASAGVFLQELLTSLREEVEQLERRGLLREAGERTQAALQLARQLDAWADARGDRLSLANRLAVRLQLADTCLLAKRYNEALELFQQCLDAEAGRADPSAAPNATALFGKAEALYQLGRYEQANELFNKLWNGLEQGSRLWWRSAVRILGCNTELGSDAGRLLRFVQQHRRVDPEFGSPETRAEFEALEKRNRQRLEGN